MKTVLTVIGAVIVFAVGVKIISALGVLAIPVGIAVGLGGAALAKHLQKKNPAEPPELPKQ